MDNENEDNLESENQGDGGETVEQENSEAEGQQQIDDQDGQKDKQIAEDQRKRAVKAEAENKALKAALAEKTKASIPKPAEALKKAEPEFALEDVAVLVQQVTVKEDRDVVKRYAKNEGKTLEEALDDPIVKAILRDAAEKRTSANATNTGGGRRGVTKPNTDTVLSNVEKGKLPDDPADWVDARMESKKNK